MMTTQLPIRVADGQITEWRGAGDKLTVSLLDWQEQEMLLLFVDVVAVMAMAPTGVDLSHLEKSDDDPLLAKARETSDEDIPLVAFRFVSAWDNSPVLTIIASSIAAGSAPISPRG